MATKRGVLRAWDGTNYLATVELDGSGLGPIAGIRSNRGIDTAEMITNRRVVVDTGDGIPAEYVVVAVYTA